MMIPFTYLGFLVGGNHRKIEFWKGMVQKIKKKLSKWRGKILSFGGKVVLIKLVITSLPLFYHSLFKIPIEVMKEIKSIKMDFLWGWGHDHRKITWVNWDKLSKPNHEGRLCVRDLETFNTALLRKWKWRMEIDKDGL